MNRQQELLQSQQQQIEALEEQLKHSQERLEQLAAELNALKKLKGQPKIRPSQLNTPPLLQLMKMPSDNLVRWATPQRGKSQ